MTDLVIVGAGALGSYLAARLTLAGFDTVLIARRGRFDRIGPQEIRFDSGGVISCTDVAVHTYCMGSGPASFVLLCVKMGDLPAALELAAPAIGPETALVTVQNGVEAPGLVEARFPDSIVLASRVHGFFEMEGGLARHVGVEPSVVFGAMSAGHEGAAERLLYVLERTGIAARISPSIESDLWAKLVLASSFGGVGAATGLLAGELRNQPDAWNLLETAMHEVVGLARCRQVDLPDDIVASTLAFVATFPPDATTSMKRDLESGKASEYESLTGAVIRMATLAGLDIPAHRWIAALIRSRGLINPGRGARQHDIERAGYADQADVAL